MRLIAKLCLVLALFTLPVVAFSGYDDRFDLRRASSERSAEFRRGMREAHRERVRESYRLRSELRQEYWRTRESFHWAAGNEFRRAMRELAREMRHAMHDARQYLRN
jgi:hypothetical protein